MLDLYRLDSLLGRGLTFIDPISIEVALHRQEASNRHLDEHGQPMEAGEPLVLQRKK